MTYDVALDVGLRMVIVDEAGGVKPEKSLPSEIEDIVACLRDFGEEIACVGLEAGTLTQWLTYGLRAAGFQAGGARSQARAGGARRHAQ